MVALITNLDIQLLKGINKCKIEDLGKVNVFIGKNDTCKSTILEAIYYTLKEFKSSSLSGLLGRRTNVFYGTQELWFDYQTQKNISINIFLDKTRFTMAIETIQEYPLGNYQIQSIVEVREKGKPKLAHANTRSYSSDFTLSASGSYGGGALGNLTGRTKEVIDKYINNCSLLDNSDKSDIKTLESTLGLLKTGGHAKRFGKYLNSIFGKGQNWEFLPHPAKSSEYVLAFTNGKPIYATGIGDGIKYAMLIIGTTLALKNTGILIEEIECNQHPASLEKLITNLLSIAKMNDLQLFVTTHSYDAWRYFYYSYPDPETRKKDFRSFHVTRDAKTGIVKSVQEYNQQKIREDIFGIKY